MKAGVRNTILFLLGSAVLSQAAGAQMRASGMASEMSAADSAAQRLRIVELIDRMTGELPRLAAILPIRTTDVFPMSDAQRALARHISRIGLPAFSPRPPDEEWGYPGRSTVPPLMWLDSLSKLWADADDTIRADAWLSYYSPVLRVIAPAFLHVAREGFAAASIRRFAETATHVARRDFAELEFGDHLASVGPLLAGMVLLAEGDTARAMAAFHEAASFQMRANKKEPVLAGQAGARLLAELADLRRDTTNLVRGLALRRLQMTYSLWHHPTLVTDIRLRELHARLVATGRTVPDVADAGNDVTLPARSPVFEHWVDRQWAILYDRAFPVERAAASGQAPMGQRPVVVEYLTSTGCSSCWHYDRVASGLARRFDGDQVLILEYNYSPGIYDRTRPFFDVWDRWNANPWSSGRETRLPASTFLSATGDTLEVMFRVNGRGVPRGERTAEAAYQRTSKVIEEQLTHRAGAHLELEVIAEGEAVSVRVHVDSLNAPPASVSLRLALVQDTAWLRRGPIRRVYQNVVRSYASSPGMVMGLPVPGGNGPVIIPHVFDLASIQKGVLSCRDITSSVWDGHLGRGMELETLVGWRDDCVRELPDINDFQLDRARLSVVAYIQSLETGEVLHAAKAKVPDMSVNYVFHP